MNYIKTYFFSLFVIGIITFVIFPFRVEAESTPLLSVNAEITPLPSKAADPTPTLSQSPPSPSPSASPTTIPQNTPTPQPSYTPQPTVQPTAIPTATPTTPPQPSPTSHVYPTSTPTPQSYVAAVHEYISPTPTPESNILASIFDTKKNTSKPLIFPYSEYFKKNLTQSYFQSRLTLQEASPLLLVGAIFLILGIALLVHPNITQFYEKKKTYHTLFEHINIKTDNL